MQQPLVTICCITYNHENFISEAIDSFLIQKTTFPIEIIIHDDASTDNTAVIVQEYAKKYPELITAILQKENQFSKGINIPATYVRPKARGKYLALCEGDDFWTDPLKLQKQVDFLEANPDYSICFTKVASMKDGKIVDNDLYDKYYKGILGDRTEFFFEDILTRCFIQTCTVVIRKDSIRFRDWINDLAFGDWPLFLLAATSKKIKYIKEPMAVYRIHKDGVWSSLPRLNQCREDIKFYRYVNKEFDYIYSDKIIEILSKNIENCLEEIDWLYKVWAKKDAILKKGNSNCIYKILRKLRILS
ncbi:MAG: glycosyltransferase [Lentisphaerota bacterium]